MASLWRTTLGSGRPIAAFRVERAG